MAERCDYVAMACKDPHGRGRPIVLASLLALVGALGRLSHNSIAFGVSGFYTSFFRGTPLIVQLFLFFFALPAVVGNLGLPAGSRPAHLDPFVVGIVVLGLNYGAYMTEIFRAGIQSVSHGQGEAADALGMTYRQKMKRVVLPQAFRVIIPPTGNEFIAMMKDTALVSFLGVRPAGRDLPARSARRCSGVQSARGATTRRRHVLGSHGDLHVLPEPAGAAHREGTSVGGGTGERTRTVGMSGRRTMCRPYPGSADLRRARAAGVRDIDRHLASARPWSGSRTCTRASATSRC